MEYPKPSGAGPRPPRRVFTAPASCSAPQPPSSSSPPPSSGESLVETLYSHPSVKIVAFSAGPRPVFNPDKGYVSPSEVEPGSLPWSNQLERTIAVGNFRIYRAPGSVAFLSCGSALQPILPKSQCWCVDEASSKFVLQIRRPQYWRIELPVAHEHDVRRALLLRETLDKILRFEKTECPFRRSFTVQLPEPPQTPVRKRPWTPVRPPVVSLPPTPVTPVQDAGSPERRAVDDPQISDVAISLTPRDTSRTQAFQDTNSPFDELSAGQARGDIPDVVNPPEENHNPKKPIGGTAESHGDRGGHRAEAHAANIALKQNKLGGFEASRPAPLSPRLTLLTSPPSKSAPRDGADPRVHGPPPQSPTDSQASFHSVPSWESSDPHLLPSPPLSTFDSPRMSDHEDATLSEEVVSGPVDASHPASVHDSLEIRPTASFEPSVATDHMAESSAAHGEAVVEPATNGAESVDNNVPSPVSSPAVDDQSSTTSSFSSAVSEPLAGRASVRHRPTTSSSISPSRRALSPLPPAANLFSPRGKQRTTTTANPIRPRASRLDLVRRLPMAVVQKTVEILLSPPTHLLNLMLRVAARISAGEWRGYLFGVGEGGETIPVRWDWTDEDDDGEGELGGWGADEDWAFRRAEPSRSQTMAGAFPESSGDEEENDGRDAGSDRSVRRHDGEDDLLTTTSRLENHGNLGGCEVD
ncbi:hypothetical protein VTK73DRAFT_6294 [Phialemonium thermophilum]|uniref:Inheritance of peroxisomes protein 1 n=1 Tax=Phialemonium thermophilum TaxID=223376 RepID=A0ABR3WKP2_9PEZI